MVKVKKELTHIYHDYEINRVISIGDTSSVNTKQLELFKKTLALTSDLKRLPFLMGGKVFIWLDAHALYGVSLSGLVGIGITAVLMNGSYNDDDFLNYGEIIADDRAKDDILLVAHGNLHYHVTPLAGVMTEFQVSHWDLPI